MRIVCKLGILPPASILQILLEILLDDRLQELAACELAISELATTESAGRELAANRLCLLDEAKCQLNIAVCHVEYLQVFNWASSVR